MRLRLLLTSILFLFAQSPTLTVLGRSMISGSGNGQRGRKHERPFPMA
jgi:hypothetical protein